MKNLEVAARAFFKTCESLYSSHIEVTVKIGESYAAGVFCTTDQELTNLIMDTITQWDEGNENSTQLDQN